MDINTKRIDDMVVVEVAGNVDARTAPQLQRDIEGLLSNGIKLIIDMAEMRYMSSAGLRVLMAAQRAVSQYEGRLALVSIPEPICDILTMTGFLDVFSVYDTLADGIAALH